jgi:hypothetical protein
MPTKQRFLILATAMLLPLSAALTGCSPATQAAGYFPPSARTRITCIIQRESGGNPDAVSSTGDHGIFQINYVAHHRNFEYRYHVAFFPNIYSVRYNSLYARYLFDYYRSHGGSGYEPWANGRYPC